MKKDERFTKNVEVLGKSLTLLSTEEYTIVDFDNSAMTVGTMTEDYIVS